MTAHHTTATMAGAAKNRRQGKGQDEIAEGVNGNGNGNAHAVRAVPDDEPRENIFLLWPNIIGTPAAPLSPTWPSLRPC